MQYFGEEASIEDLKNNLNSAVNGFQTITMNDNISDVIVKTNEGYLFEAYFDEVFSDYYVEYMGQIDPSYIPEVNITYREEAKEIKVEAKGNISKITITQNEKEIASGSNTTLTCIATNSGIYKITVQSKERNNKIWICKCRTKERETKGTRNKSSSRK